MELTVCFESVERAKSPAVRERAVGGMGKKTAECRLWTGDKIQTQGKKQTAALLTESCHHFPQ